MRINPLTAASYLRFTRRDWLIGLLIILLVFTYRLIIIIDHAHAPGAISAFDPLPAGSDQLTYFNTIQAYLSGGFPPPTFFYQPGPSYLMVVLYQLMNTDNVGSLPVDSPPRDGRLLTSSLPMNYLLEDTKSVNMPENPDTYTLYVGVYNNHTMERLTVPDTADNLVSIGEVLVSPSG